MSGPVLKFLNVGGSSKTIPLPECFDGWQHDLLDIDPRGKPDILCDARELWRLPPRVYDAVYCAHNLEHYYRHDVYRVLKGISLVLKKSGFAYITVPDLLSVMKPVVEDGLDIDDVLYQSRSGPILVRDVLYGYHVEIEKTGQDYYSHKTGFTEKALITTLGNCGFQVAFTGNFGKLYEVSALAFLQPPTDFHKKLLGI